MAAALFACCDALGLRDRQFSAIKSKAGAERRVASKNLFHVRSANGGSWNCWITQLSEWLNKVSDASQQEWTFGQIFALAGVGSTSALQWLEFANETMEDGVVRYRI